MRLLIIHQYFKLPIEGGGIRSYHLANYLISQGHDVEVWTGHNRQNKIIEENGIRIRYFKIPYSNNQPFWRRLIAFGQFVYRCRTYAKQNHKYSLSYVISTPLTTGLIGLHLKSKYKIPYVFEVGDLWPEVPVQMGIIRNRLLKNWLYQLELKIYVRAERIVALSPDIKRYIDNKTSEPDKTVSIPNFSDIDFFKPSDVSTNDYNKDNPFTIGYFGTIGIANHLEYLVHLGKQIAQSKLPVQIIIMGDGMRKNAIRKMVENEAIFQFVDYGNKEDHRSIMNNCDAIYVSYKNVPILGSGSPNKFFDGLAAGKIVMINFQGWIKDLVLNKKCGIYQDPETPSSFMPRMKELIESTGTIKEYQQNSRELATSLFSKSHLLKKWRESLHPLIT